MRLERKRLALDGEDTPENLAEIQTAEQILNDEYEVLRSELNKFLVEIKRDSAFFEIMDGRVVELQLADMISVLKPNGMNVFQKLGRYVSNFYNFIFDEPREANTEGGVFPAIFGTVIMVLLMSVLVTPSGRCCRSIFA